MTWEFLRPPTIDALRDRLDDTERRPVDILHFDGHGVFDDDGLVGSAAAARGSDVVRSGSESVDEGGMGYLLFEDEAGNGDLVSADQLGENLHRRKVSLVVLSACQTAALGDGDEPMTGVAARLTAAGLPAVLAMTHSVLVPTTRTLFGEFYKHLALTQPIGVSLDPPRALLQNRPQRYEIQRGPNRQWLELSDWFVPALYQGGEDAPLLTRIERNAAPIRGRRPRVFISHSSVDKVIAARFANSLDSRGWMSGSIRERSAWGIRSAARSNRVWRSATSSLCCALERASSRGGSHGRSTAASTWR